MKKDPRRKALNYAHRLLNIRPRSVKEVYGRLRGKGYSGQLIDKVVKELEDNKLLDDFKFARLWIDNRLQFKPKGVIALRYELKEKGISTSVIDKAINEKAVGFDEYETARELAEEKLQNLKDIPEIKQKKKIYGLLYRRGFKFEVIERILEEI